MPEISETTALDPADILLRRHLQDKNSSDRVKTKIVEFGGRYGFASVSLLQHFPDLSFEVRCPSLEFIGRGEASVGEISSLRPQIKFKHIETYSGPAVKDDLDTVSTYIIRNMLCNWPDEECEALLHTMLPVLRASADTSILVTDGLSPTLGEFPPDVEIAFRRRDITMMAMHNVKQRNAQEWLSLFRRVDPALEVCAANFLLTFYTAPLTDSIRSRAPLTQARTFSKVFGSLVINVFSLKHLHFPLSIERILSAFVTKTKTEPGIQSVGIKSCPFHLLLLASLSGLLPPHLIPWRTKFQLLTPTRSQVL